MSSFERRRCDRECEPATCRYCCRSLASDVGHDPACPLAGDDVESDLEVYLAGAAAAADGDNCYAEAGTTFWLGWLVTLLKSAAAGNRGL